MTLNLEADNPKSYHAMSNDIRQLFRNVALVKPDVGMIMRAKCASFGFKAPIVLGSRLKVLAELARDQL